MQGFRKDNYHGTLIMLIGCFVRARAIEKNEDIMIMQSKSICVAIIDSVGIMIMEDFYE